MDHTTHGSHETWITRHMDHGLQETWITRYGQLHVTFDLRVKNLVLEKMAIKIVVKNSAKKNWVNDTVLLLEMTGFFFALFVSHLTLLVS